MHLRPVALTLFVWIRQTRLVVSNQLHQIWWQMLLTGTSLSTLLIMCKNWQIRLLGGGDSTNCRLMRLGVFHFQLGWSCMGWTPSTLLGGPTVTISICTRGTMTTWFLKPLLTLLICWACGLRVWLGSLTLAPTRTGWPLKLPWTCRPSWLPRVTNSRGLVGSTWQSSGRERMTCTSRYTLEML